MSAGSYNSVGFFGLTNISIYSPFSGYDTPLYNDYLHTWDTLRIPNQTTSGVIREEIVWMNYTHQLSLYDFGIL